METLTPRDRELVALGAARGSGCTSCVDSHTASARAAGVSDAEIQEALRLADQVRRDADAEKAAPRRSCCSMC